MFYEFFLTTNIFHIKNSARCTPRDEITKRANRRQVDKALYTHIKNVNF